jgi:hypothetical protein
MHLWTTRCRGISYNIFQEKSASYGLENTVYLTLNFHKNTREKKNKSWMAAKITSNCVQGLIKHWMLINIKMITIIITSVSHHH